MNLSEIELHIQTIANNSSLYDGKNFDARTDAIDFLEFNISGQIDTFQPSAPDQERLAELQYHAEKVKSHLQEIDNQLFSRLKQEIKQRKHGGKSFENLVREYVNFGNCHREQEGYDNLDIFINCLLSLHHMPEQSRPLEPEMVFYQKTPARVIFEMVKSAGFAKEDTFFDIGSGLGQVVMLVNLLTGLRTVGVEFDSAFCQYSYECAATLGLQDVAFVNADARDSDYTLGTVFFIYTPFRGTMLEDVLEMLKQESLKRKIRIVTYGPCTPEVAAQDWLRLVSPKTQSHAEFISAPHYKGMR
jgi:hypothetical protein